MPSVKSPSPAQSEITNLKSEIPHSAFHIPHSPSPSPSPSPSAPLSSGSPERLKGRDDLQFFAQTFFPDFCTHDFSILHLDLFERRKAKIHTPLEDRRGSIDVVLAPRGAAKSTLVSLIFPAHAILYDLERYIIILSATERQATRRLAALRDVFLTNSLLREHFKDKIDSLSRASAHSLQVGRVRVDALSPGTELRGLTHGPWRPTWVILDDVERSERIRKACHRDNLSDWFTEVVNNLGASYTNIDLIGTLLHRDALPARLAKRPDVAFKKHSSILREADNAALWNEWRAIYGDLANPDRDAAAREFFKRHESEMLLGAEVLWPARESYYDLVKLRETCGRPAFDKEKQNAPWADGTAVFANIPLRRFRLESGLLVCDPPFTDPAATANPRENGRPQVSLADLRIFGFLDPALGRANGDYAAVATVGIDPDGYLYVLDVWLSHLGPSIQSRRLFDLFARWDYQQFGFEGNSFQSLYQEPIENERGRRKRQGAPSRLPVTPVRHACDKQTRILTLEPYFQNGWILLNSDLPEEFMTQLLDFPNAAHDDGPDALAAAVKLARESSSPLKAASVPRKSPGKMGNY